MLLLNRRLFLSLVITSLVATACRFGSDSQQDLNLESRQRQNGKIQVSKPIVIMVSIDGFRADYLEKFKPPTLLSWAHSGVVSKGLQPSFPSLTFPNHITLVTGRYPGNHGIVGNSFYDEKRKESYEMGKPSATLDGSWYRGEPIWTVAENNNMLSATCFWVGSEAKIQGVEPSYMKPYDGAVSNAQRIDWVIEWLKLPENKRPHIINLYFSDVDSMGHKYGPNAKETGQAVAAIDAELARLKSFAEANFADVQFVIVSDHGMKEINETIDLSEAKTLLKMKDSGRGALVYFYSDDEKQIATAYQEVMEIKNKSKGKFKVYRAEELPSQWQLNDIDRRGDIIVVGEPGVYIGFKREEEAGKIGSSNKATHGWDASQTDELNGLFIASGSLFKKGMVIEPFSNVHIYPLLLSILDIKASQSHDGDLSILAPIMQ